jgi:hypothetical protein
MTQGRKTANPPPIPLEAKSWAETLAKRVSTRTLIAFWIFLGLPLAIVIRSFWQSDAESSSQRLGAVFVLVLFLAILSGITVTYFRSRRTTREMRRGDP